MDDLLARIRERAERQDRVLVTTLTKRMAEDLTDYLRQLHVRVRYLHSTIDSIERVRSCATCGWGNSMCSSASTSSARGLDLPEVSLVAILDADKEGFLRSERSLIQTAGRAARNVRGEVIFYADNITNSMQRAMEETDRRRTLQKEYNELHGIEPETVYKSIEEIIKTTAVADVKSVDDDMPILNTIAKMDQSTVVEELKHAMYEAARQPGVREGGQAARRNQPAGNPTREMSQTIPVQDGSPYVPSGSGLSICPCCYLSRLKAPSFSRPVVTYVLLAVNAAVFLFQAVLSPLGEQVFIFKTAAVPFELTHFVDRGTIPIPGTSVLYPDALVPFPLTLFTAMFVHGGSCISAATCFTFGSSATAWKAPWGSARYLLFYLLAGLCATLVHVMSEPDSAIPMIGASGAIAGVLGAYFILYPRAHIKTFVLLFIFIQIIHVPAVIILGIWFLRQILASAATAWPGTPTSAVSSSACFS